MGRSLVWSFISFQLSACKSNHKLPSGLFCNRPQENGFGLDQQLQDWTPPSGAAFMQAWNYLWVLISFSSPIPSSPWGWKPYVSCFSLSVSASNPCLPGLFKYRCKRNCQDIKKTKQQELDLFKCHQRFYPSYRKKFERFFYILKPIYYAIPYY